MQREKVPFDDRYFSKERESGLNRNTKEVFEYINKNNHWSGEISVSGAGSDMVQTATVSQTLPELIKKYQIKTFLDLPCGDFNWMKEVELNVEKYIGCDIVQDVIEKNKVNYSSSVREFRLINLIEDKLPDADLLFCRDCLVHLSNNDINKVIRNLKRSNIKYILTTTFTECYENKDIATGDWRIINLCLPPFNLSAPVEIINENCTEGNGTYNDKSLALWRIKDLV